MSGVNGLNDESILDVNKVITGKDGRLYVKNSSGQDVFLAEVDTFQAQINPTSIDIQPVGSPLQYAVNTCGNGVFRVVDRHHNRHLPLRR